MGFVSSATFAEAKIAPQKTGVKILFKMLLEVFIQAGSLTK